MKKVYGGPLDGSEVNWDGSVVYWRCGEKGNSVAVYRLSRGRFVMAKIICVDQANRELGAQTGRDVQFQQDPPRK